LLHCKHPSPSTVENSFVPVEVLTKSRLLERRHRLQKCFSTLVFGGTVGLPMYKLLKRFCFIEGTNISRDESSKHKKEKTDNERDREATSYRDVHGHFAAAAVHQHQIGSGKLIGVPASACHSLYLN
jgi:hypothetical protein